MILIFQERKRRLIEIRGGALPPAASVRLPRAAGGLSWALCCDGQGSGRAPRGTGSGERYDPRHRGAGGTGEVAAEEEKQTNTPPLTREQHQMSGGPQPVCTRRARGRIQGFVTEAAKSLLWPGFPPGPPEPCAGSLNALQLHLILPFRPSTLAPQCLESAPVWTRPWTRACHRPRQCSHTTHVPVTAARPSVWHAT